MRDGCPFCDYDGPSKIVAQFFDGDVYLIEPIAPVCDGHLLVIPRMHVRDFTDWRAEGPAGAEKREAVSDTFAAAAAWAADFHRDYNLITSKGALATQTVMHFHVHLVPRREGDGLRLPWS